MSEINEIKETIGEKPLTAQENISPSSINNFHKCPRSYYYNYIAKLRLKPSRHLIKGSIVHKVLEDYFREYKEDQEGFMRELLAKAVKSNEQSLNDLELSAEDLQKELDDCWEILTEYRITLLRRMTAMVKVGKAENLAHAFYSLKPKFREMKVKDEDLHCLGFIDRVTEDYDGIVTLGDYKTSSKHGIGLPSDYKRQLSIYALLYKTTHKITPDFVAVIFLRYGEEYLLEVTPSLLKYARDVIDDTYSKTRTTDIANYPLKEGALCKWCSYYDLCSGATHKNKEIRLDRIRKLLVKPTESVGQKE
jgi:putative RecB family exonuclease